MNAAPQHALTVYGEPAKYPAGFSHFAYTNPQAPKGGTMRRSAIEIGHFDHVLPYIDKGIGVTQIDGLLYSPLAQRSLDEPYTVYGLVAQQMERSDDGLSLRFYLNPKARFADGKPITAQDVRYTFDLLMTQGSLRYRTQFADVKGVEVESPLTVRFDFKNNENRTLPLDIATLPVFPEHWWKTRDFANGGGYEPPLGSGPYKVGKVDSGRSITFERNPDWWGKDLPVSRGLYNFDHFSIEYFGDTDVARQVLRGGAYDYNREFSATGYSIGYDSPALSDGRLQKGPPGHRSAATGPGFRVQPAKADVPGPSGAPGAGDALGFRVEQPADDARHVHPPAELLFQYRTRRPATAGCRRAGDSRTVARADPRRSLHPGVRGTENRWQRRDSRQTVASPGRCSNRPAGNPRAINWSTPRASR